MKKKKTFGLFGTNKRKPARKGDKRIKEYDDYYEEEEYEDQEYAPEDDEGALGGVRTFAPAGGKGGTVYLVPRRFIGRI